MNPEVVRSDKFVDTAAALVETAAKRAIAERGYFRIALSGGNTPRPVYKELARRDCDWPKWIVTFGDERCVPPDNAESNFRMASESLLAVAKPGEVLRMEGEINPEQAATNYATVLRSLAARFNESRYVHDLILLGLGGDGHTASLFPQTAALKETEKDVVGNFVPKFNTYRITFTYPLINAARHVVFLVNDPSKQSVIDQVLKGGHGFPSEGIRPVNGQLTWLLGSGA
jgi:6-phosphogluconolactonase